MTQATRTGGCLCGAVRYAVQGPLQGTAACHCSQCRRMTGSFWMSASCADPHFTLTKQSGLAWYRSSSFARRGFCNQCGCVLFWKSDSKPVTEITPGTLDGDSGLHIGKHIFCADKGDYYEIADGLPQHAQGG